MQMRLLKRPKVWLFPYAIELRYRELLLDYVGKIQAWTKSIINIRQDIEENTEQEEDDARELLALLLLLLLRFKGDRDKVIKELNYIGSQINDFNRAQFNSVLSDYYNADLYLPEANSQRMIDDIESKKNRLIDTITQESQRRAASVVLDAVAVPAVNIQQILDDWESENVRVIDGITEEYQRKAASIVSGALVAGVALSVVRANLIKLADQLTYRAKFIAETQTKILNAQLLEKRARSVGIDRYRWRGKLDARERPLHRAREGRMYRFSNPPSDGNPSVPYGCRCWAELVMPLFKDLIGVFAFGAKI